MNEQAKHGAPSRFVRTLDRFSEEFSALCSEDASTSRLSRVMPTSFPDPGDPLRFEDLAQRLWILAGGPDPLPEVSGISTSGWASFLTLHKTTIKRLLKDEFDQRSALKQPVDDLSALAARLFSQSGHFQDRLTWSVIVMSSASLLFLIRQPEKSIKRKFISYSKAELDGDSTTSGRVLEVLANAVIDGELDVKAVAGLRGILASKPPALLVALNEATRRAFPKHLLEVNIKTDEIPLNLRLAEWCLAGRCSEDDVVSALVRSTFATKYVDEATTVLIDLCRGRKVPRLESLARTTSGSLLTQICALVRPQTLLVEILRGDSTGLASHIRAHVASPRKAEWENATHVAISRISPELREKIDAFEREIAALVAKVSGLTREAEDTRVKHQAAHEIEQETINQLQERIRVQGEAREANQEEIERIRQDAVERSKREFLLRVADQIREQLVQHPDRYPSLVLEAVEAVIPDLQLIGMPGQSVEYDALKHELVGEPLEGGSIVTVAQPGYCRSSNGDMLRRAVVRPFQP